MNRNFPSWTHALEKMHLSGLATVTNPPTHFPMSLLQTPDIRARISLRNLLLPNEGAIGGRHRRISPIAGFGLSGCAGRHYGFIWMRNLLPARACCAFLFLAVGPARATALPSLHASALSCCLTADHPRLSADTDLRVVCLCWDWQRAAIPLRAERSRRPGRGSS